jgi:hypothetical protein
MKGIGHVFALVAVTSVIGLLWGAVFAWNVGEGNWDVPAQWSMLLLALATEVAAAAFVVAVPHLD